MRKKQTLSILVWNKTAKLRKRDGKSPIYFRIVIDGKRLEIATEMYVIKDHWDRGTKTCSSDAADAHEINKVIREGVEDLKVHFRLLKQKYAIVTSKMLKNVYLGIPELSANSSKHQPTLLFIAGLKIKSLGDQVKENLRSYQTLQQWRATCSKIKEFAFYAYKKHDILLTQVDEEFADELFTYLTVNRRSFLADATVRAKICELDQTVGKERVFFQKRVLGNLAESAAKRQIKHLKLMMKLAVKKKFLFHNPIVDFKCSGGDKEVVPLELHEVRRIHSKNFDIPRLDEVKDAFIFQCFTGFSFQDIYNLSPQHILKVGKDAEPWLIKERGKTNVSEMVPILPIISQLIEKYKDHPHCVANNKLMPINSNTKYNGYLKEVANLCGIRRVLKTHLARHTFADIMLNVCNVPLEDVSKMLGHRSQKTTQRYCQVKKERISTNMKTARSLLFNEMGDLKF